MSIPPDLRRRLSLAAALLCAQHALAQPADTAPQQVTVSGSRTAINPNTPAATDSIDRSRLADLNIANPEDSIKYLPNIATRKRFIGDRNGAIESRGTNNRMSARGLVLADGVLLSNFLGSQDQIAPRWSMVFPEEIDRVDVVYGPFSALYSGNAIAVAVLFTTRMPKGFEANAGLQLQRQRFDFLGTSKTLHGNLANAFIGNRNGAWAYQLGVSHLDSTSQPTGFAALTPSTTTAAATDRVATSGAYTVSNRLGQDMVIVGVGGGGIERTKQTNLKFKLSYDIEPTLQARLTAIRWTNDRQAGAEGDTSYLRDSTGAPIYTGPVAIAGRRYTIAANTFSPRNGEEEHRSLALMLKSSHAVGWNIDAVASSYDFAKNIARTSSTAPPLAFSGGAGTMNRQDGSGWRTLDLKVDRRPGADDPQWLTLGAHWAQFVFKQDNFSTSDWLAGTPTATTSTVRAKTETQALFVQDAWSFAGPWKAIVGLRAERWRSFDGSSVGGNPASITLPARSETAWSPKAALEWAPDEAWLARLALARATRFPTPVELFQGNISAVQQITSDPNLKPERGLFTDLTVERYFPRGSARLTLFNEDTRDTLFNQSNGATIPSTSNAQNIDRVRVRGIELAADTRGVLHPKLDLSASVAYNDSRVLANRTTPATVGKRFAQLPLTRATAIAIWRQTQTFNVSAALRQSGRQYANLNNDDVRDDAYNSLSSFAVVDLRANWQLSPQARLSLGLDNAGDKRYFVNHPFPGRSLVVEVKLGL